ncbi:MAG TPA: oligosaccharide flippase family protein [Candidatus Cloacimonadota bacterium]|nr:oligosaccharide flippase family protein [Candidatus Cloacimonadota bacterium]
MSHLVKQAGLLSAADFSRLAIKALVGFILARLFTQADYGSFRQLYLVYTTFSALLLLGLPQSILYFLPKIKDEAKRSLFIRQCLIVFSVLGILFSAFMFLFRHPISLLFHNPSLELLLVLYCLYPIFSFISLHYNYTMLAEQKPKSVAIFTIFSIVVESICVLGAAFITRNLFYTTIGILAAALIQYLYAMISLRKYEVKEFHFDLEILKEQLHFSLPIGLSAIVSLLAIQIDKFVISSYYSPEVFAVFSVGAMEVPLIGIILNAVNSVIMPELSKLDIIKDKERIEDIFRSSVRNNALMVLPMFVFFFIFAKDFMVILYSAKYIHATIFFRIYLLTMPLRIAVYSTLIQVGAKTKFLFYSSVLSLVMNLAMNLVLVHLVGQIGPAISTVIVIYISIALYIWVFKYQLGFRLRRLFPVPDIFKTILTSILTGVLVVPILLLHWNSWFRFILAGVCYFALFFLLGSLFNVIKPYDRGLAMSMIREGWTRLRGVDAADNSIG